MNYPFMPYRILIVDDEKSIAESIGEYFLMNGFDVDSACSFDEAIRLINENRYSVVLSDLNLGGGKTEQGFEIFDLLRKKFPLTEAVMLTAYSSEEVEKRAKELKVSVLLKKPKALADVAQVVYGLQDLNRKRALGYNP